MSRGITYYGRPEERSNRTFGQAAQVWLKKWTGKDKRRQAYALESVDPYIGPLLLDEVYDGTLERFIEDRLAGKGMFEKPVKVGTINKELRTVSAVLNTAAKKWRWMLQAPIISQVQGPIMRPHPLTWKEQDALFSKLPEWWAMGPALFAVNTGARMGEIIKLEWNHMQQFGDKFVFIVHGKNGKERPIICNSLARLAVDRQRGNGTTEVFTLNRKRIMKNAWVKPFNFAWKCGGLPDAPYIKKGAHNLRHTFGCRLAGLGVPEWAISRLLGHANADITQHYAQPTLEMLQEHSELLTHRQEITILRSVQSVV
jgi:integrase